MGRRGAKGLSTADAEDLALEVLGRIAVDPERLGRFLALSGLDPATIRKAASEAGFLPAVLDHAASDEPLLVAVAGEIGVPPERIAATRQVLQPDPDWSA